MITKTKIAINKRTATALVTISMSLWGDNQMHLRVISDALDRFFLRVPSVARLISQLAVALFMQRREVLSGTGPQATGECITGSISAINPTENNLCLASP